METIISLIRNLERDTYRNFSWYKKLPGVNFKEFVKGRSLFRLNFKPAAEMAKMLRSSLNKKRSFPRWLPCRGSNCVI